MNLIDTTTYSSSDLSNGKDKHYAETIRYTLFMTIAELVNYIKSVKNGNNARLSTSAERSLRTEGLE